MQKYRSNLPFEEKFGVRRLVAALVRESERKAETNLQFNGHLSFSLIISRRRPFVLSTATCRRCAPGVKAKSGDKSPHSKGRSMATPDTVKEWPHAPVHRLSADGVYMVTAATLYKGHLFETPEKLTMLENHLLSLAKKYNWQLEAWAVFANHYHFVARARPAASNLIQLLRHLHADTARELNCLDQMAGRTVWYNFWDTKLTYERSYLARLNYVHQNPVKHGLVRVANQYEWCSAAWFERTAPAATVKTIYSFKIDKLKIDDDY